jgi:hypothetical protein
MIYFLNWKSFVKGLTPVTTTEMLTRTGEFHQGGLFSEVIFGPVETPNRKRTFSYINLNVSVVHPSALKLLLQLDKRIELFLSGQQSFSLDADNHLVQNDKGSTGINAFITLFPSIKFRGGTDSRDKYIKKLEEANKEGTLFVNIIPVIPPDQRPLYQDEKGQWVIDNLNNYYITILKKSLNVKTMSKSGPLFDLLNYEVQKSVIEHDDYIRALIQKKHGLIRSQILGKRTDFSGRAVITPGPDLKVNEIGLPFRMAISLFEPFILHRLLYSGRVSKELLAHEIKSFTNMELSIDSIKKVFKLIRSDDKIPDSLFELLYRETEVATMNRVVLAKRDPVLHAESIRAFYVKLVRGNTIQICTLQVGGFNADFDGDSCLCSIIYAKTEQNIKCHIKDFLSKERFILTKKEENNNIMVTKYNPIEKLFIKSIDIIDGKTKEKQILEYSKHENIEMYKIHDSKNRFEDFWSSYDHSLIVYDENDQQIKKISPKELLKNSKDRYLIQDATK